MNDVYPGESRYILEAFCIAEGEVEFFDLGKSPIYRETFTLGSDSHDGEQDVKQEDVRNREEQEEKAGKKTAVKKRVCDHGRLHRLWKMRRCLSAAMYRAGNSVQHHAGALSALRAVL